MIHFWANCLFKKQCGLFVNYGKSLYWCVDRRQLNIHFCANCPFKNKSLRPVKTSYEDADQRLYITVVY